MTALKILLEKINLTAKAIIGIIASIAAFFLFFFIRSKVSAKKEMAYRLEKVKSEIKIAELEAESDSKKEKLEELKKEEEQIRLKIKYIEEKESSENRDVTLEELDDFFDSRGF